jgi:hypothetical protein
VSGAPDGISPGASPPDPRSGLFRARVALRERTLLDVLDLTVRFMIAHAGAFARVAAVVLVPSWLLTCALGYVAGWGVAWAFALVLALTAEAPFTVLASRLVFEDGVRTRDVLGAALAALPRLVVARVLQVSAIAVGLVAIILPGAWAASIWIFVTEVVTLERSGPGAAFGRSRRIARSGSGDALVAVVLLSALPVASALVCDVAGRAVLESFLESRAPASLFQTGGGWLSALGFWGSVPFVATARFFLYLNFRTKSEGWDIQTRFAALASRAALEEEAA